MKQNEYSSMEFNDKRTLSDTLSIISNFMASDIDSITKYRKDLLEFIKTFELKSSKPKKINRILGKRAAGKCITKPRNIVYRLFKGNKITKYQSKVYIDDTITEDFYSNILLSLHEMNHADTNQHSNNIGLNYYSGLRKYKFFPIVMGFSDGEGLNESINELYAQIQLFNSYPKVFNNIDSVDQLIYGFYNPTFNNNMTAFGDKYRKLWPVVKLLILACDNNPCIPYESLKDDKEPLIEKKVELNNKEVYKNDLLYAGKKNSIEFEKEFNELMGKGEYIKLLKSFDQLLKEVKENDKMKKDSVVNTIKIIDEYKNRKYDKLVKDGLINLTRKAKYEYIYNSYRIALEHSFNLDFTKKLTLNNKKTGN